MLPLSKHTGFCICDICLIKRICQIQIIVLLLSSPLVQISLNTKITKKTRLLTFLDFGCNTLSLNCKDIMAIMLLSKSYRKIEKHIKPCFLNKSVKYHITVTDTLKETFTTYILSYLSASFVLRHVLYVRQVTILLLATILNQ